MSYIALYRKFRPKGFEEVKGQEHIVTTLKNQIKAERIGHAYLFCGTRGTGKTTVAKIFAKAVNCESQKDGSPCGECPSCKAIQEGNSMNVMEIDAASNNSVEDVRKIQEEVSYSPTKGKYKVYIIDEAHMLSQSAFNALLKTLEEPPSYVIFILATTEVHKIPITILSRCQRYDFRRITIHTIAERLQELLKVEEIEAEERGIFYIAKAADGSLRDAISLLDRCIAFFFEKTLTYENVLEVLGAVDTEVFSKMLRRIHNKNISKVILGLEELIMDGREPEQFITDFIWYLRNILLLKSSDPIEDVLDISAEHMMLLKEEAAILEVEEIMYYIQIFSDLIGRLRYSTQKRVLIEIELIKLCKPEMESNMESLLHRIKALEKAISEGISVRQIEALPESEEKKKTVSSTPLPKAIPEDLQQVVSNWPSILQNMPSSIRFSLKDAVLSIGNNNNLLIVFQDEFSEEYLSKENHKEKMKETIAERIGKDVEIEIIRNDTERPIQESYPDLRQLINFDVTVENLDD